MLAGCGCSKPRYHCRQRHLPAVVPEAPPCCQPLFLATPCSFVLSPDGKLCLPRKCPAVPAGEAPWVPVQSTADGTLVCVR